MSTDETALTAQTSQTGPSGPPDLAAAQVVVIGAGNMGGPVVRSLLRSGIASEHVSVHNSSEDSSARAAEELGVTTGDLAERLPQAELVVLGVKPYQILDILDGIRDDLPETAIVLSLAAGLTLEQIAGALPEGQPLLRVMPNTPIAVGQGVAGVMAGESLSPEQQAWIHEALAGAGQVVDIAEEQVHAFIGAAGSAPAFFYTVYEAMIDEAVRQGLKRDLASTLVLQTGIGAAAVLQETGVHPAVARQAVSSPGGTTVQGSAALERGGVRVGLAAAMQAAAEKSREMSGD